MERITLNLIPKGITPVCHASQYDEGRAIRLDLMDDLQGYVLSTETITVEVRKPDNNIVTASVEVVSGKTYCDVITTEQMTACEGDNKCELHIVKGYVEIGSLNFIMRVEEDPLAGGIESETVIHNLETQIADIDAEIVPPLVAQEVANQYDSENVIFDSTPTAGHGNGYAVTSEGVKDYVDNKPNALVDLTDVDIDSPTSNQALVWDNDEQKWVNGEVSTVGGLNDLNDVTITDVADKQELVYDDVDDVFKNKTTRVELTQAEYNQLVADDEVLPDVDYYITDAPSMQGTSADLSYDGDTDSVYDVVEGVKGDVEKATSYKSIYNQTTYQNDIGTAITTLSDNISNFRFLRVIVYISSISSSSRGIALVANLKQAFGDNYLPICINGTQGYIRIETTSGKSFTLLALSSTLGNSCCVGEVIGIY